MENPTLAESLEQQLQELRENEQRILRVLQDLQGSVDQLSQQTADASWTAYTQEHKNQLQHLRYVRVLRAKEAGPLPCGLTPAEVEALLQCERGAVRHVEPQRDNAKGKQRVTVRFSSAEAATAAYNSFQRGNNTTNAVLDLRRTRLQNTLVDLAIQIQRVARGECGWGEELLVRARGTSITVKVGGAEPVPFPFRQHLPGGGLPDPGQPLPPLNIALVKHQLDRFRMPPPSKPAAPKPAAPKPTIPKPAAAPKPGAAPKPVAPPKSAASPKPAAPKPAAPPKPATGRSNATSREQEAAFLRALETRLDNFSVHIDNKFDSLQVLK